MLTKRCQHDAGLAACQIRTQLSPILSNDLIAARKWETVLSRTAATRSRTTTSNNLKQKVEMQHALGQ
jgi:hypothetical protein